MELLEAVEADLPNMDISGSLSHIVVRPTQLFLVRADEASKVRNQAVPLQLELKGIVGAFNRKARIPLNGPLKATLPGQSTAVELFEGVEPRAKLMVENWAKHHVIIVKTSVPVALGPKLRSSIRCYFLVDPIAKQADILGVAKYGNDSTPLGPPNHFGPTLAGDVRWFNVPEQVSLKDKELCVYEFDPDHSFDVVQTIPNFTTHIPSEP